MIGKSSAWTMSLGLSLLLCGTGLGACAGDESAADAGAGTQDGALDAEGCEHIEQGPATAVTAATEAVDTAAAIAADHHRYDVTLVDVAGGNGGFVRFASARAGHTVFFLTKDVPFAVADADGEQLTPRESATSSAECTSIHGRYVVEMAVGTYFVEIGPTEETSVSIVVESEEHAHEH